MMFSFELWYSQGPATTFLSLVTVKREVVPSISRNTERGTGSWQASANQRECKSHSCLSLALSLGWQHGKVVHDLNQSMVFL